MVALVIPIMLLAMFASFAATVILELLASVFGMLSILVSVAFLIFVTVPVFGGFFEMSYRLYMGEDDIHMSVVFAPFVSVRRYLRAVRVWGALSLRFFVLLAIPLAASALIGVMSEIFAEGIILYIIFIVIAIAEAAIFAAAVFFMVVFFLAPYFVCQGYGATRAMLMSAKTLSRKKGKIWKYIFGFSGIFALSLLSVGMLFVIYTVPMMIFAYFIYAEKIIVDNLENTERGNENEG